MARTKQTEPKRIADLKKAEMKKSTDPAVKTKRRPPVFSQATNFKREYRKLTGKKQSLRGLLPRAVISRICREILHENNAFMGGAATVTMIAAESMKALEQSIDAFAHTLFERTAEAARHAKRKTATVDDLRYAVRQLHGSSGLKFTDADVAIALSKK